MALARWAIPLVVVPDLSPLYAFPLCHMPSTALSRLLWPAAAARYRSVLTNQCGMRCGKSIARGDRKEVIVMKLMTKDLLERIPPLYSQENEKDPRVFCKFFTPSDRWTWYVLEGSTRERDGCGFGVNCNHRPLTEYDPQRDDILFFGYRVSPRFVRKYIISVLGYFTNPLSNLYSP